VREGLSIGQKHDETEALAVLTETAAGLTLDGIWALVALLEHAARRWMTEFMEPGEQSVGTRVAVRRCLPAPHADTVRTTATLCEIRGRRYIFDVELRTNSGELIASGSNERAVVAVPSEA
jgi:predicted thioesterase